MWGGAPRAHRAMATPGFPNSWYMAKTGKPNLYPWHLSRFYKEMEAPKFSEYQLVS